jgi:hypothetical protein
MPSLTNGRKHEAIPGIIVEPLGKEMSVEDTQKVVDANEKLVKELKNGKGSNRL